MQHSQQRRRIQLTPLAIRIIALPSVLLTAPSLRMVQRDSNDPFGGGPEFVQPVGDERCLCGVEFGGERVGETESEGGAVQEG